MKSAAGLPETLGTLRNYKDLAAKLPQRTVKDELRENLICRLQKHEPLFPGIVGFDDTVVPQVVNAVLSR
ncbi:MAG: magnesium chelatase, partial [Bryobacteraceae bacterium]